MFYKRTPGSRVTAKKRNRDGYNTTKVGTESKI